MKVLLLALPLLLLSCNPAKEDIDKGIQEMSENKEEAPAEDTVVKDDCVFDTGYYRLTMEALRGIPDVKDIQWIESEHMAVVNWRGDEVRRSKGGCQQLADNLSLISRDETPIADALHWLGKAQAVTKHFGIPYFSQALTERKVVADPTMSDEFTHHYSLTIDMPEGHVTEGFTIQQVGGRTRLDFRQYQE